MFCYETGTLTKILDEEDRELSLRKALKNPALVSLVVVYLDDFDKSVRLCPNRMYFVPFEGYLYIYTNDGIFRAKVFCPVKKLLKDACLEIRSDCDDCAPNQTPTIKVHFKQDLWKAMGSFEDPNSQLFLYHEGKQLGKVQSLSWNGFSSKVRVETEDYRKFLLKLKD